MKIRLLQELIAADELTLRFTPLGFGVDYKLTPDGATEFHQRAIGDIDLVESVPAEVQSSFEKLRSCHTYVSFATTCSPSRRI